MPLFVAIAMVLMRNPALHPQPGIGLVNIPVAPNSAEWKTKNAQDCIGAEKAKHERRGTWNLKSVMDIESYTNSVTPMAKL